MKLRVGAFLRRLTMPLSRGLDKPSPVALLSLPRFVLFCAILVCVLVLPRVHQRYSAAAERPREKAAPECTRGLCVATLIDASYQINATSALHRSLADACESVGGTVELHVHVRPTVANSSDLDEIERLQYAHITATKPASKCTVKVIFFRHAGPFLVTAAALKATLDATHQAHVAWVDPDALVSTEWFVEAVAALRDPTSAAAVVTCAAAVGRSEVLDGYEVQPGTLRLMPQRRSAFEAPTQMQPAMPTRFCFAAHKASFDATVAFWSKTVTVNDVNFAAPAAFKRMLRDAEARLLGKPLPHRVKKAHFDGECRHAPDTTEGAGFVLITGRAVLGSLTVDDAVNAGPAIVPLLQHAAVAFGRPQEGIAPQLLAVLAQVVNERAAQPKLPIAVAAEILRQATAVVDAPCHVQMTVFFAAIAAQIALLPAMQERAIAAGVNTTQVIRVGTAVVQASEARDEEPDSFFSAFDLRSFPTLIDPVALQQHVRINAVATMIGPVDIAPAAKTLVDAGFVLNAAPSGEDCNTMLAEAAAVLKASKLVSRRIDAEVDAVVNSDANLRTATQVEARQVVCGLATLVVRGGLLLQWNALIDPGTLAHIRHHVGSWRFAIVVGRGTVPFIGAAARNEAIQDLFARLVTFLASGRALDSPRWTLQALVESIDTRAVSSLIIAASGWPRVPRGTGDRGVRIPRVALLWHGDDQPWLRNEASQQAAWQRSGLEPTVANMTMCRSVAALHRHHPAAASIVEAATEPGKVYAAAYCRVLLLHRYGGLLADMDTAPEVPLPDLLDAATGPSVIFFGLASRSEGNKDDYASMQVLTSTMAAAAGDSCLDRLLVAYEEGYDGVTPLGMPSTIQFTALVKRVCASELSHGAAAFVDLRELRGRLYRRLPPPEIDLDDMRDTSDDRWLHWRRIAVYLPVPAQHRTARTKERLRELKQRAPELNITVVDDAACFTAAAATGIPSFPAVPPYWWAWLPFDYRTAFCGVVTAAVTPNAATIVVGALVRARRRLRPEVLLDHRAPDLMVHGPDLLGITNRCASALATALWSRAVKVAESVNWDVRANNVKHPHWLREQQQRELLMLPRDAFASMACDGRIDAATPPLRFPDATVERYFDFGSGAADEELIPFQRHVVLSQGRVPDETEPSLRGTGNENQGLRTHVHSLQDCLHDMRMKLGDHVADAAARQLFAATRVLCELFYVMTEGGVVIYPTTTLPTAPLTLWLDVHDAAFSYLATGDGFDPTRPTYLFAASPNLRCVGAQVAALASRLNTSNVPATSRRGSAWATAAAADAIRAVYAGCRAAGPKTPTSVATWDAATVPVRREFPDRATSSLRSRIPRQAFAVWKTTELFDDALAIDAMWRVQEPTLRRRIVPDSECRDLAAKYPGLLGWYDNFPLNVMRADTCRVLVVYFYGGIYMDLDVAWQRPIDEWFDWSKPVVAGNETDSGVVLHYCNWFFAAEPKHSCMASVLDNIILRASEPFARRHNHFVHMITGPSSFTEGLKSCGLREENVTLSRTDIGTGLVLHEFGSQKWANNKHYESWVKKRDRYSQELRY